MTNRDPWRLFDCPSLNSADLPPSLMLQNFPSILAVDRLDPKPGERILDMCAAPGGKTCHIAARLNGKGIVVALDKTKAKIDSIKKNCIRQNVDGVVETYVMDATKTLKDEEKLDAGKSSEAEDADLTQDIGGGEASNMAGPPPWHPALFDRVLLDAPCSALGQRPQFYNPMKEKELASFPKIQRKLFKTAASHLKPGGTLVYSTCTANPVENEEMVAWALETLSCLEPVPLNESSGSNILLFGHPKFKDQLDTISFCIAKFRKKI